MTTVPVLTKSEAKALQLCADGFDDPSIAGQLKISQTTVSRKIENVRRQLLANTRTQAVQTAIDLGLIKRPESDTRITNDKSAAFAQAELLAGCQKPRASRSAGSE